MATSALREGGGSAVGTMPCAQTFPDAARFSTSPIPGFLYLETCSVEYLVWLGYDITADDPRWKRELLCNIPGAASPVDLQSCGVHSYRGEGRCRSSYFKVWEVVLHTVIELSASASIRSSLTRFNKEHQNRAAQQLPPRDYSTGADSRSYAPDR